MQASNSEDCPWFDAEEKKDGKEQNADTWKQTTSEFHGE